MEESAILLPIAAVLLVKVQQQAQVAQGTASLPGWATSVANPALGPHLGRMRRPRAGLSLVSLAH
jgi:hypothetical protein